MTLEFSATVDGDAITGTVKLGAFGEAEFSGTRASYKHGECYELGQRDRRNA